ncbi:dTDP-3-amino-3,6-dideoxy-alpha-D-galactopyranose 3-N-acetyltransferase [Flavobacterium anhuiense]|uniref:dTDP-3-amino-3,6-dideoxy-alpha-D-galactopyranose 3-N-acetyltransferase n=1 Tax=Flavobacterium anhuiense TaxID=459526 RepID=A0AAC9D0E9_9FLAO|nr:acyltransferase [Flavobacterium anhuiense]AOC95284.1 dTDP-3-amino-3,6-dideoxy-alpha-D-galactopyranose 3-N-acetyltransferase [Flavobacterium anhuiense]
MSKNKIHALADVQSSDIGNDTYVWQFTVILSNAKIGDNCNINCNCFIENDVIIGNNVTIKSGVQIWDGVRIEDNVFVGPNVTFTNDLIPRSKVYPKEFKQTILKTGSSIGANSTIVAGIEIGEMAFVGAGSVLTKSIAPYTVWYGNPAIQRGFITEESILLDMNLKDKNTGERYYLEGFKPVKK